MNTHSFKLLLIVTLSLPCCDTTLSGCQNDYEFELDNKLYFFLLDEHTNENLLEISNYRYIDSEVALYDKNLKLVSRPETDGSVDLNFLKFPIRPEEPLNSPLEQVYYFFLENGDYDTLKVAYTIGINECDNKDLTHWKVSYNDSVYIDTNNESLGQTLYFLK